MKYYLSATEKSTFVGDVFPLWLCSDTGESLSKEDISFTASNDALTLRSFKGEGSFAFADRHQRNTPRQERSLLTHLEDHHRGSTQAC